MMGTVRDACGKGYHVASLWEIFDFTALQYDKKRGPRAHDGIGRSAVRHLRRGSGPRATTAVHLVGSRRLPSSFTSSEPTRATTGRSVRFPRDWAVHSA